MFCPQCGAENTETNAACVRCGSVLPALSSAPQPAGDSGFSSIIPYKNTTALLAYYRAVFSLIPCFGLFLGIAAFMLGLRGLRFGREHPEARGVAHAWVGILLGGLCGGINLLLMLIAAVSAVRSG